MIYHCKKGENMRFLNYKHAMNFQKLIHEDSTHPKDYERYALFYIISGNEDLFKKRNYIYDFKDNSIKSDCLTNENVDFGASSKALIRLAFNLYNCYEDKYTTPVDIFYSLDSDNYNLAMKSVDIRFGSVFSHEMNNVNEEKIEDEFEI